MLTVIEYKKIYPDGLYGEKYSSRQWTDLEYLGYGRKLIGKRAYRIHVRLK